MSVLSDTLFFFVYENQEGWEERESLGNFAEFPINFLGIAPLRDGEKTAESGYHPFGTGKKPLEEVSPLRDPFKTAGVGITPSGPV